MEHPQPQISVEFLYAVTALVCNVRKLFYEQIRSFPLFYVLLVVRD